MDNIITKQKAEGELINGLLFWLHDALGFPYYWSEHCRVETNWQIGSRLHRRAMQCIKRETNLYKRFFEDEYGATEYNFYSVYTKGAESVVEKFKQWFENKRKQFMEKATYEMAQHNLKQFKKASHSGVAALLNALTKTMEKQGADIKSIAKVQYAVCVQAGIYIPDEFILDVAIALDATEEINNEVV